MTRRDRRSGSRRFLANRCSPAVLAKEHNACSRARSLLVGGSAFRTRVERERERERREGKRETRDSPLIYIGTRKKKKGERRKRSPPVTFAAVRVVPIRVEFTGVNRATINWREIVREEEGDFSRE